jgi:hypothetical protein
MSIRKPMGLASVLLCVLLVMACASPVATRPAEDIDLERPPVAPGVGDYGATASGVDEAQGSPDRMIVRTASVSLVVTNTEDSVARIKSIVGTLGGYVVDTRLWRDEGQLRGSVTVRVPSESLDDALDQFKTLAVKVERESGSSQDVTEEYTDVGARLRNLEATEQELLELKGRMQYLERTAAMAAVTLELIPDVLAQPIDGTGWRPSATVAAALRSLLRTLRFLADAVIVLALYVLPLVILLLIPVAIVWSVWRRWRHRKPATKA